MKRVIIANWKMNLRLPEAQVLAHSCLALAETHQGLQIVLAPSLPWLMPMREALKWLPPNLALGSQVVSQWPDGAYTGDVSAQQLKGLVTYCLVGHSERRRYHHENGEIISAQVEQLIAQNIIPVICFGEMSESHQKTFSPQITVDLARDLAGLSREALAKCLFAYEPLWAIGTGHPATPEYARKIIIHVKAWANEKYSQPFQVLYGGSVTEENTQALGQVSEIDGLLVGGASLHIRSFRKICSLFATPL